VGRIATFTLQTLLSIKTLNYILMIEPDTRYIFYHRCNIGYACMIGNASHRCTSIEARLLIKK